MLALCPDKQGQPVLAALASIKANGPPIDLEATGRPPLMSKWQFVEPLPKNPIPKWIPLEDHPIKLERYRED